MKRFLFFTSAFLILNFCSQAQVIIMGGKVIVNGCRLMNKNIDNGSDSLKYDFTWGFSGGAYLRCYFNDATYYSSTNVSLCVEALFNSYGQNYHGDVFAADTLQYSLDSKVRITSLDVPVMINIRGQAGLYSEFGVSFGMIQGVKEDFTRDPQNVVTPDFTRQPAEKSYSTSNLSAIFGFGIDSELSDKLDFMAGLRFTYGITDLTQPQKATYLGTYNQTHSLSMGITVGCAYILNFYHDYH